jgi:flagellar basal body-associated protein FliL
MYKVLILSVIVLSIAGAMIVMMPSLQPQVDAMAAMLHPVLEVVEDLMKKFGLD